MKRGLLFGVLIFVLSAAFGDGPLRVAVGVPPLAGLAQEIGGGRVKVVPALPPGRSPHDYAPSPREVRELVKTKLFLHTGLPYEHNLIRTLAAAGIPIAELGKNVRRIPLDIDGDHDHDDDHGHGHDHGSLDPHIWLAVENLRKIAPEIAEALIRLDPAGAETYRRNLKTVEAKLQKLDSALRSGFARYRGRAFMVHHAAFGYFAHEWGLRQLAVELGGREPSPRHLAQVAKQTRAEKIKVIFVQPQFNPGAARALASATGARIVEIDPLAPDVCGLLDRMGATLREAIK